MTLTTTMTTTTTTTVLLLVLPLKRTLTTAAKKKKTSPTPKRHLFQYHILYIIKIPCFCQHSARVPLTEYVLQWHRFFHSNCTRVFNHCFRFATSAFAFQILTTIYMNYSSPNQKLHNFLS